MIVLRTARMAGGGGGGVQHLLLSVKDVIATSNTKEDMKLVRPKVAWVK